MAKGKPANGGSGKTSSSPRLRAAVPPVENDFFVSLGLKLRDDPFDKPYQQHPWIYACGQVIGVALAQLPARVYRQGGGPQLSTPGDRVKAMRKEVPSAHGDDLELIAGYRNPRTRMRELRRLAPWLKPRALMRAVDNVEILEEGPWVDLFRKVNPLMTASQLWEGTFINYNVGGECFWILEGEGPGLKDGEIPREIWPVSGHGFTAEIDKRTQLPKKWKRKWNDGTTTQEAEYDLHEVVRFARYNPYDAIRGLAPFHALKREVEQDYLASMFQMAFFKKGAQIGGWVTSEKKWTPEQRKDFLQQFEARHAGAAKAHRPAVFEGGVSFTESKQSHRNMQFKELREWVRDAVLSVYRVPKAMLGIGDYSTRATALAETRNFWETNLLPQAQYAEDLMESDLLTPERRGKENVWVAFDLSVVPALREDLTEQVVVAKDLVQIGWTANDVNERLDLGMPPDHSWNDTWYKPNTVGDVNAPPPAPKAPPNAPPADTPPADTTQQDARPKRKITLPSVSVKDVEPSLYWEALVARVFEPGETRYEKKFRGFLLDLRSHQLRLIDQRGEPSNPELVLFDEREWRDELSKRTEKANEQTFMAATEQMIEEIASTLGKASPDDTLDVQMADTIKALNRSVGKSVRTIRRQLDKLLREQLGSGATLDALKLAVREYFSMAMARGRSRTVARYATSANVNAARELAMQKAGVRAWRWINANDENVRDTHVSYGEGGAQALGFNWPSLIGRSYTLQRPCQFGAPAEEVIGCRCVASVVA